MSDLKLINILLETNIQIFLEKMSISKDPIVKLIWRDLCNGINLFVALTPYTGIWSSLLKSANFNSLHIIGNLMLMEENLKKSISAIIYYPIILIGGYIINIYFFPKLIYGFLFIFFIIFFIFFCLYKRLIAKRNLFLNLYIFLLFLKRKIDFNLISFLYPNTLNVITINELSLKITSLELSTVLCVELNLSRSKEDLELFVLNLSKYFIHTFIVCFSIGLYNTLRYIKIIFFILY